MNLFALLFAFFKFHIRICFASCAFISCDSRSRIIIDALCRLLKPSDDSPELAVALSRIEPNGRNPALFDGIYPTLSRLPLARSRSPTLLLDATDAR